MCEKILKLDPHEKQNIGKTIYLRARANTYIIISVKEYAFSSLIVMYTFGLSIKYNLKSFELIFCPENLNKI